jgi:hypothetical protein
MSFKNPPGRQVLQRILTYEKLYKKMFALDSAKCRFHIHGCFIKWRKEDNEKRKDVPVK